jgi:hypothetical protein
MILNVISPNLSHIPVSHWNNRLRKFSIDLEIIYGYPKNKQDPLIITDTGFYDIDDLYDNVYLWIIESPLILEHFHPGFFNKVNHNMNKFKKIFTHDRYLTELNDKFVFKSHGDCSINDYKNLEKNKLISMISSNKRWVDGHELRHQIIKKYHDKFDLYGHGFNDIDCKEVGLNQYAFSIAVENCNKDYYFTEKIIDCFRTKTIPIYWGCPSIGDFFDKRGIIQFNKIDDLESILNSLDYSKYYNVIDAIETNYKLSFEYDTFFTNFKL